MPETGFCETCYSWGQIADPDKNLCTLCKEKEIARTVRVNRPSYRTVRPLSEGNARGRE